MKQKRTEDKPTERAIDVNKVLDEEEAYREQMLVMNSSASSLRAPKVSSEYWESRRGLQYHPRD